MENLLNNVNPRKAAGFDNMPTKSIKIGAGTLAVPLAYIINKCFSTGLFPNTLKIAKVIPLHKKARLQIVQIIGQYQYYQH